MRILKLWHLAASCYTVFTDLPWSKHLRSLGNTFGEILDLKISVPGWPLYQ